MINVIVAFSDHSTAQKIRTILTSNGVPVAGVATCLSQIVLLTKRLQGRGIIICQNRYSDGMTAIFADEFSPDYEILMLVHGKQEGIISNRTISTLSLPLKKNDLIDSVKMLISSGQVCYNEQTGSKKENDKTDTKEKKVRSAEEIKLIDDAKSVLMERNNLTEEQAHRFLQKRSMDNGSKLTDTAKLILERW